jgi:2',3'-cyclic-nucleotide 2'-phosphodiesterase/3'-nucleotidase
VTAVSENLRFSTELSAPVAPAPPPRVTLRILATTDLHGHILPWDDLGNRPAPDRGLAQISSLIAKARAEVPGSLLLDNGDFLNGSPLADHVAQAARPNSRLGQGRGNQPHPMIAAMNHLGYDAVTLGNHEFSEGLGLLRHALRQARFATVCTNLDRLDPTGQARRPFVPRQILLRRQLWDQDGTPHEVVVGILGFLPPQTTVWERHHLAGKLAVRSILDSVRAAVPRLRHAGADLVIALSHSGIGEADGTKSPDPQGGGDETISGKLAQIDGIDAVVAGHTHQLFPPAPAPGLAKAKDHLPGALAKPIVMPGFYGSHLGVLDLALCRTAQGWRVERFATSLRPVARRIGPLGRLQSLVKPDPKLATLVARDVANMRAAADQPIGVTAGPLHSYFALIGWAPVQELLARAQAANMRRLLTGKPEADWPLLVAAAPFKAGGRAGPSNYIDIPPGPLTARHIADLYMHPNSPVALRMTGADLARWLERSVSLFHTVQPGSTDATLIDPGFPSHNFDMIHGLSYTIDLSQPARHDAFGHVIAPKAQRIRNLRYQGQPVRPTDRFVLATNSYRTGSAAGFFGTHPPDMLAEDNRPMRHVLHDHIRTASPLHLATQPHWGFAPMPATSVIFDTSPGALTLADQVPPIEPLGLQPTGFLRFRLRL